MPTPPVPDHLLREAVEAMEKHGRKYLAAKALGLHVNTFVHRLEMAKRRGITTPTQAQETLHGWNPAHDLTVTVPEPLILRGTSTYYNKEGVKAGQWVKTKVDDLKAEAAMRAAVEALAREMPRAEPVAAPSLCSAKLCNLYTLTDCHVGMRAWSLETGADWDIEIAEKMLVAAVEYLIGVTPRARVGFINQLGDFLHFDSLSPVTPTNQHPLDADSRYSKVVKVATRIIRRAVDAALERHEQVVLLLAEGNHDMASSVWLRHLFSLLYENEPRVNVVQSEMPYYVHVHGKTLLTFHHGHLRKPAELPLLFAAQFPKEWGATTKRYCHTGHQHHVEEKEHNGMKVMQHATLAARDAYASRNGWVAERQIKAITYHSEYGETLSSIVVPEMLD